MGLGNTNGILRAEDAPYATGTPKELKAQGKDLKKVGSCAVPVPDGRGGITLRGCPHAEKCSLLFGGRNKKIGEFGPKSDEPGTAGQGPENVPYSIETVDGDYKEDFMVCHRFMSSLYARLIASAQRTPDDPKSETIRILGVAGKAKLMLVETFPEDPISCNKNGNTRMVTETNVVICPVHPRPAELEPRAALAAREADADVTSFIAQVAGESKARDMELTENEQSAD